MRNAPPEEVSVRRMANRIVSPVASVEISYSTWGNSVLRIVDGLLIQPSQSFRVWQRNTSCAQIVPKIYQKHLNISKDIELYRNPKGLKSERIFWEFNYFLHFSFFRRFLHTVEVRGSSPLSPTIPLPEARSACFPLNGVKGIRKSEQGLGTRLCMPGNAYRVEVPLIGLAR